MRANGIALTALASSPEVPPGYITCQRCASAAESVSALASHLAVHHLISPSIAQAEAQDAVRLRAKASDARPTPAPILSPPARAVTAPVTPPPTKEPVMATKPQRADPENCKHCKRFAPEKCKRHGGKDRRVHAPRHPAAAMIGDNGARATAKALLAQLEALRARLDDKIGHVRELADIL